MSRSTPMLAYALARRPLQFGPAPQVSKRKSAPLIPVLASILHSAHPRNTIVFITCDHICIERVGVIIPFAGVELVLGAAAEVQAVPQVTLMHAE